MVSRVHHVGLERLLLYCLERRRSGALLHSLGGRTGLLEGGFSEELLAQVLRGMSARQYQETVTQAGKALGVSPSSTSRCCRRTPGWR